MTPTSARQPAVPLQLALLRWLSPAKPEQQHVLPRFEQETRRRLTQLSAAIFVIQIPFWLIYIVTDFWLYPQSTLPLLGLRSLLIINAGIGIWLFRRDWAHRYIYRMLLILWLNTMVILTAMGIVSESPTGLYSTSLFGAMGLAALLPGPMLVFLLQVLGIAGTYTIGVALAGQLGDPAVIQFVLGLTGGPIFFAAAHYYLEHQRWANFLTRIKAEQLSAQLANELATARRIQQSLLPPASPGWAGIDLCCWSEAAREVGGDFYAYVRYSDDRLGFAVGDVSGKGMPAALLMSTSLAYLRSAAERAETPAVLLTQLDRALAATTRATRQNCALCCVEVCDNIASIANAGGIAPLLRRADGSVSWVDIGGLPLGTGLNLLAYRVQQVPLAPGDQLVLVSDGIVEAMREDGELFGFERLEQALGQCEAASAFELIALLRESVAEFVGPAESHDDMTIAVLCIPWG